MPKTKKISAAAGKAAELRREVAKLKKLVKKLEKAHAGLKKKHAKQLATAKKLLLRN